MKHKTYLKPLAGVVFTVFFTLILISPSYALLSGESYCQLTIETAQQELDYLNGLTALTQKYCNDPNLFQEYCNDLNSFLEEKLILQEEFDSNEAVLFDSFNTTAEEYAAFAEEDANAVEKYLNNDPNIKQAIDGLSGQIDDLLKSLQVPSYCLSIIAITEQEIDNLNELIALVQVCSDDPDTFLEQEQIKRVQFDNARAVLLAAFEATENEYVMFMGKNAQAVEQYLEAYPHIKQGIDTSSSQLHPLLGEYETLRESIIKGAGEEPPR